MHPVILHHSLYIHLARWQKFKQFFLFTSIHQSISFFIYPSKQCSACA